MKTPVYLLLITRTKWKNIQMVWPNKSDRVISDIGLKKKNIVDLVNV